MPMQKHPLPSQSHPLPLPLPLPLVLLAAAIAPPAPARELSQSRAMCIVSPAKPCVHLGGYLVGWW